MNHNDPLDNENPSESEAASEQFDATSDPDANDDALDAIAGEIVPDKNVPTAEQQIAELKSTNLKLHAELENVRKRIRREAEEQIRFASLPLMQDLLQVFDNLRRALDAAQTSDSSNGLIEGVQMVAKQFEDTLGKFDCKPIAALGQPFDPNIHEAISQMPSDDYEPGMVMIEATKGFQLHDRVVRPSQVVVSAGK